MELVGQGGLEPGQVWLMGVASGASNDRIKYMLIFIALWL